MESNTQGFSKYSFIEVGLPYLQLYMIDVLEFLKADFESPYTSSHAYKLFISNLLKLEIYRNALKRNPLHFIYIGLISVTY
ncbi:hypothetical protein EO93_17580 [Methanosarcina sp. 1.H.A.2.2]|nr:hypothetical protein EO93_17580 [Methanosarcina sp. 1.H.A.2.2]